MNPTGNQIVVYQPSGVTRIEVRFDGETAWLALPQIAELFSCSAENVRLHLKNIYASGELDKEATSKESLEVRKEGSRNVTRRFVHYNLDAIISVGYRVNSIVGVRFRQWATGVIKERMFAGAALAAQFASIDRRLLSHDKDLAELKDPSSAPASRPCRASSTTGNCGMPVRLRSGWSAGRNPRFGSSTAGLGRERSTSLRRNARA